MVLENSIKRINNTSLLGKVNNSASSNISFDFEYGLPDRYIIPTPCTNFNVQKINLAKIHGSVNFKDPKTNKSIIVPPTWNKTSNKLK